MLKKILKISLLITLFLIFLATVFYFVTYPLIPKHFATLELREYFVFMEEDGEKFMDRELIDCSGFVTERDAWRNDMSFLLPKGEDMTKMFEESWEAERQCLHSQVDQSYDFVLKHKLGVEGLNTALTDFAQECDMIVFSFSEQLKTYDLYKEHQSKEIDTMIEHYDCRLRASKGMNWSQWLDGEETSPVSKEGLEVLNAGFDECYKLFLEEDKEISERYSELWEDLKNEQNRRHQLIEEVKEGLDL